MGHAEAVRQYDGLIDVPRRPKGPFKRQPVIVVLPVILLACTVIMCAVLMIPILWAAVTETAQRSRPTYQRCGSVQEDTNRLACYDDVSRQTLLRSTKNASRMTFGELLGGQRDVRARDISVP